MNRRSFVLALFGGSIAASAGAAFSVGTAEAAQPVAAAPETIDTALGDQLDATDAEFAQYHPHGRPRRRGPPPHARGWGPPRYRHHRRGPPPGYYRRRRHYRRHRW